MTHLLILHGRIFYCYVFYLSKSLNWKVVVNINQVSTSGDTQDLFTGIDVSDFAVTQW